jgi:rhamnogalacturonan endolyase
MKYMAFLMITVKRITFRLLGVCMILALASSAGFSAGEPRDGAKASPDVTLKEDVETYTMDNGIVQVRVSKVTGDLLSFRYKDMQMFETKIAPDFVPENRGAEPANNPNWKAPVIGAADHGYWSHNTMGVKGSAPAVPSISIDPAKNGGERAEVSIKANSKGRKMGTGPGTNPAVGDLEVDIDIRYTLERGASGVYTYCTFNHPADYSLAIFGEARFCMKLAPFFDWVSIDKEVNREYTKNTFVGDKYVFTTNPTNNRAWGWSSTSKKVGMFMINPSMEYISGGPTKFELTGHLNTDAAAAPCVLNYWRSSHYGGAEANIAAGEEWHKTIGPFYIYANSGDNPDAIYADARTQAIKEAAKWPYNWVEGIDYPKAKERSTVKGRLVINDVQKITRFDNFLVGLTHGEYISARATPQPEIVVNWQRDAKYYQYWTKGNADGSFEIPNVREGRYTMYAFTNGVLGEFMKSDIVVEKGKPLNLGKLEWVPVRKGKQVWDIGIPNRNAVEFKGGDRRREPAISLEYPKLFPNDVTYVIGKSDFSKDWFYQHIPHNTDPNARVVPFSGIQGAPAPATPYTIRFDMPSEPAGKAYLRFAICGTGARSADVEVNGQAAGKLQDLLTDGLITRHGESGLWYERSVDFDASMMKKGANTIKITMPGGSVNNGLVYDYIRLELADNTAGR